MAIIETLTTNQVAQALYNDDNANWSYTGAQALASYLDTLADDLGDMELDVVAIRCEYSEYSLEEVIDQYPDVFQDLDEDEKEDVKAVIDALIDHTIAIKVDADTVIIQDF